MGSGSSVGKNAKDMSADEIGEFVSAIGPAYSHYKALIVENGVSGEVLVELKNSDEIKSFLGDLGITNKVHQSVLSTHFNNLIMGGHDTEIRHADKAKPVDHSNWVEPNVVLRDCVSRTPRDIMTELFVLQGVAVDPSDIDSAMTRIVTFCGSGFGDGVNHYDCFLNYRVATDAELAEKIYYSLKSQGLHPFLDKKCLKSGMNWKDGFLQGLKKSKCFVAIISSAGLTKIRDLKQDHTFDNVLLEYETALEIMRHTENSKYILPLHVGAVQGGVLTKFSDFNPSLYADSLSSNWSNFTAVSLGHEFSIMHEDEIPSFIENILDTMLRLMRDSKEAAAYFASLSAENFWDKFCVLLTRYTQTENLVEKGLNVTLTILENTSDGVRDALVSLLIQNDIAQSFVKMLKKLGPGNKGIMSVGLRAIRSLFGDCVAEYEALCANGHVMPYNNRSKTRRVCDICRANNPECNCDYCGSDYCLSCYDNKKVAKFELPDFIAEANLSTIIIEALKSMGRDSMELTSSCFNFLQALSLSETERTRMGESNGLTIIVQMLALHGDKDFDLANMGVYVACNLSVEAEVAGVMGRAGLCEVVMRLLYEHARKLEESHEFISNSRQLIKNLGRVEECRIVLYKMGAEV